MPDDFGGSCAAAAAAAAWTAGPFSGCLALPSAFWRMPTATRYETSIWTPKKLTTSPLSSRNAAMKKWFQNVVLSIL